MIRVDFWGKKLYSVVDDSKNTPMHVAAEKGLKRYVVCLQTMLHIDDKIYYVIKYHFPFQNCSRTS